MRRPSLMPVDDPGLRRLLTAILNEVESMSARLGNVVSESGVFIGNLPAEVKITTAVGDSPVVGRTEVTEHVGGVDTAAGALASKDSVDLSTGEVTNKNLDNITDGPTYGRVLDVDLSNGRVIRVRDNPGDRNIAGSNIFDKGFNDLSDVTDDPGGTWRKVASVDANNKVPDGGLSLTTAYTPTGASNTIEKIYDALDETQDEIIGLGGTINEEDIDPAD